MKNAIKFSKTSIFLLFVILTSSIANSQEKVVTKNQEVHLQRSSILVSNLDRSLEVYRDILGFKVAIIAESDKDSYVYPVFRIPKEAKVRVATLNSNDQNRIINLKEVTGVELPRPVSTPFMSAVLIRIDDITSVMKKINDLGLESTEIHVVKGSLISYTEQSFIDPDGHLVALY